MSRIGRAPVVIPAGVNVDIKGNEVSVKGPLGTLSQEIHEKISVVVENNEILCKRSSDDKNSRALHGLSRALVQNMVDGVTKGFEKSLLINGVGYKAKVAGKKLTMNIGYSHPVDVEAPEGISFVQAAPLEIVVKGIDKQLVGQVAAAIRAKKVVEPYHGYGIQYKDEVVVRKEGKTAGK